MPADTELARFEQRLGYQFQNPALLRQALTHRSYGLPNNERMEFLGDSILNCVIAISLFKRFSEMREGEMSRLRATLVRQEGLHQVAMALNLSDVLRLGEGELKSGGSRRPSILADALEAVFAAVYLDRGLAAAQEVIDRLYASAIEAINPKLALKDPKTALQEWLQGRKRSLPTYVMVTVQGEAHAQQFEVECVVEAFGVRTRGRGTSRRAAEQAAAELAMAELKKL